MTAFLMQFLLRIGKIRIVSISDSYMFINTFKKPPSMSREVVRTNYASQSPYKDAEITSLVYQNDLLVWFTPVAGKLIRIPEAFLLYRTLISRDQGDRICIFNTNPVTLIVIRDGALIAQSILASDSAQFIERLKKEHAIITVERYSVEEHAALLSSGYAQLSLNQWQQLLAIKLPNVATLKDSIENVATPLSVLVLLALGYHYGVNHQLTQRLEESRSAYQEGRGSMIPIKHRLDVISEHKQLWDSFIMETLVRPDALIGTLSLLKAARESNTTITYVKISGGKAETVIETKSTEKMLKALVATKKFENLKLEFSKTDPIRNIDSAKIIANVIDYDVNGTTHEY